MKKAQFWFFILGTAVSIFTDCNNPNPTPTVPVPLPSEWLLIVEGEPLPKEFKLTPPRSLGGTKCPTKLNSYLKQHRGWMVSLKIHIDPFGKAVKAECVSETSEMGQLYADWAKSWNYQPAKSNGRPISSVWQIRIPQIKTTTTITTETR